MGNKHRVRKVALPSKAEASEMSSAEPAYQLNDHVQCNIEQNIFIGRILQWVPIKNTFLYKVGAELPSGITPLAVGQEQIVGLV